MAVASPWEMTRVGDFPIYHSGMKKKGRPRLLLQLRPDGKKWPYDKPITQSDLQMIVKMYVDFIEKTVREGYLQVTIRKALALGLTFPDGGVSANNTLATFQGQSKEATKFAAVSDLLDKNLDEILFSEDTLGKLRWYAPTQKPHQLETALEQRFDQPVFDTIALLGFDPDKDVAYAIGGCAEYHSQFVGKAYQIFFRLCHKYNLTKANHFFPYFYIAL